MKKYLKRIITACLGVCMIVCLGIFAVACSSNTVKVTVLDADGNPLENMEVQFCVSDADGNLGLCLTPIPTDKNGVSTLDYKSGDQDEQVQNAKYFMLHILNVPKGFTYDEVLLDLAKTKTATIQLKADTSSNVPDPNAPYTENVTVALADEQATQEFKPAIKVAGFYTMTSAYPFNAEVNGHKAENAYSIITWLDLDDKYTISASESAIEDDAYNYDNDGNYTFVVGLVENKDAGAENKPIEVSMGATVILELQANQTVHFSNPATVNNHEGSNIVVNGTNFKSGDKTDEFFVAKGVNFAVTTTNGQAGKTILNIDSYNNGTTANIGEATNFSIDLLTVNGVKGWICEDYYIEFTTEEAGNYSIDITSEYATEKICVSQIGSDNANHYPNIINTATDGHVTATCKDTEKDKLKANTTYRIYFVNSNEDMEKSDYKGFDDDKVNYTVTITKA